MKTIIQDIDNLDLVIVVGNFLIALVSYLSKRYYLLPIMTGIMLIAVVIDYIRTKRENSPNKSVELNGISPIPKQAQTGSDKIKLKQQIGGQK